MAIVVSSPVPLVPLVQFVKRPLGRTGIFLDYDNGAVSFCDAFRSSLMYSFFPSSLSFPLKPFLCLGSPWMSSSVTICFYFSSEEIVFWKFMWGLRMIPDYLWAHCNLMIHNDYMFIKWHDHGECISLLVKFYFLKNLLWIIS